MISPRLRAIGFVPSLLLVVAACGPQEGTAVRDTSNPPTAQVRPTELTAHGVTRVDDYYWLRERENPEVIAYLEAENAYTERAMAHTEDLQATLFREIRDRIKPDDSSVPYQDGDYFYYTRYEEGMEYPIYARRMGGLDTPEEVMLDGNAMAEGHDFFAIGGWRVTENGRVLAFGVDTQGRRFYTIRFKDLDSGEALPDVLPDVTGNMVWANDNRTLFYVKQDPETLRSFQLFRHELGTDPATDELIYEEEDPEFSIGVGRTKSDRYVVLGSTQTLSSEFRVLDADDPGGEFRLVFPRESDHEYSIEHAGDYFYIRTNDHARNFRLVRAPVANPSRGNWEEVIPHRDEVLLETFDVFRDHLVLMERSEGLLRLRIIRWDGSDDHYLDFGEPAYLAYPQVNLEIDTNVLRYGYTSLTTPNSVYDYNMDTRERILLKQDEVLGGYDPGDYTTERRWATARDGVQVPVSIVYRNETPLDGSSPGFLYAYGSYGYSTDAAFDSPVISLLDRGFVYAIAHVRGGQELGRAWYEEGKLLRKKNTFTDFIDVAEFLIAEGYFHRDLVFAEGGSAGGLLMGAIANMRPDLWKGVIAHVPWVDVVTTMLDETIPLTTSEYDEWGDPREKEYFDYMLSYSPYDQVEAKEYPNIMVTTGLADSQVQYWEPAKWVAKLRAMKTDDNLLILKTNMEAGHGGVSGRFRRFEETALQYAFMLDLAGLG